jgi:Predicted dehydrogenases and related proteins
MKVAIIGTWHVHTTEYATAIQEHPQAELVCCWDNDAESGRAFAEKMNIPFVEDVNEIWKNPEIDSVQITTATTLHKEVLIAAAKSGKNIFTEKVLAVTNEEADEIAAAIKASTGKFTISFPHKTTPAYQAAKKLVDDGTLGKITYARIHNFHNGSIADWLPDTFYNTAETGGGAMMDLGAHPMYTLNAFLGTPKSIVSMFTDVTNRGVEDNAVSVIEFENGAIGVSETGFVTEGNNYMLEMSGTEGSVLVHPNGVNYTSKTETDSKCTTLEDLPERLPSPIVEWIEAVIGNTEPPCEYNVDKAVALTNFMVGAYASHESGKKYHF